MKAGERHHDFRLDAVKVIDPDSADRDYTLLTVYRRRDESEAVGQKVCDLRADEALALGDLLRFWAQSQMSKGGGR